jgi:teichuronic acid biosynthesis glycosyltransferase TuaG
MENDTKQPLISVITPIYNSEKYIDDTIESVLAQTYTNWEMLVVDDCSTDKSALVVKKYAGQDRRIKYLCLERNSGAAIARNKALELAMGEIVAFLDADDIWKPEKLEKQLKFTVENDYGFTFSSYEIMRNSGNKVISVPRSLSYDDFMKNTIIGTLTVMINKKVVGDVKLVNVKKDHDSMTWAKILRSGHKAYGLNESLAIYRKVEGSISNNKIKAVQRHWRNCREIEHLSLPKCSYYFMFYIFNAVKKHYM